MIVRGAWLQSNDGTPQPIVHVRARARDGSDIPERFLIDTGADQTVLRAGLLFALDLPLEQRQVPIKLSGIGGAVGTTFVTTRLRFERDDGLPAAMNGQFAAFTDHDVTDISILGRDVLHYFDLILSLQRNEVLLIGQRHRYVVVQD